MNVYWGLLLYTSSLLFVSDDCWDSPIKPQPTAFWCAIKRHCSFPSFWPNQNSSHIKSLWFPALEHGHGGPYVVLIPIRRLQSHPTSPSQRLQESVKTPWIKTSAMHTTGEVIESVTNSSHQHLHSRDWRCKPVKGESEVLLADVDCCPSWGHSGLHWNHR